MLKRILTLFVLFALLVSTGVAGQVPTASPQVETLLYEAGADKTPLRGVIGIPQGSDSPLVVLLHGRHLEGEQDTTPYYQGLVYLARELAARGFFALSIDMNPVYQQEGDEVEAAFQLVESHLALLGKANGGEKVFKQTLQGKADMNTLYFVGHSRGGGIAPLLANLYLAQGKQVKGSILLAPTSYIGIASEDGKKVLGSADYPLPGMQTSVPAPAQVPTAVLVPQFDGDMPDLPGYSPWLNAMQVSRPKVPVLVTWLKQANHVSLNSELDERQDPQVFDGAALAAPDIIRAFAARYVGEACSFLQVGKPLEDMLHPDYFASYPLPCALTAYAPGALNLVEAPNLHLKGIKTKELSAKLVNATAMQNGQHTSGLFAPPGLDGTADSPVLVYETTWQKADKAPRLTMDILPLAKPLLPTSRLLITWAVNASNSLNDPGLGMEVEIILSDSRRQAAVALSSQKDTSLQFEKGAEEIDPLGNPVWSRPQPLLTQVIPLERFAGADLGSLKTLTIVPKLPQGALMLYSVQVLP